VLGILNLSTQGEEKEKKTERSDRVEAILAHLNLPKNTTAKLAAAPNREAAVTGTTALCS
jgi:hypothetical protein